MHFYEHMYSIPLSTIVFLSILDMIQLKYFSQLLNNFFSKFSKFIFANIY